jgi:anti-sigma factor RsiW
VTVDLEGARCDEEAARLLPWYVAGRLSAADLERVSSHLQRCAICRNDLAHERAVQGLLKADTRIEYAPQAGLAKILSRIDEFGREAPTAASATPASRATGRRFGPVQWLTAAVLVQALALGWLGASLRDRPRSDLSAAPYQTLSADSAPLVSGAHIRAVFAPAMTLAELKSLLSSNNLTIIRGPSDAGAYTLASTATVPGDLEHVVTALRTDARVLFVEAAVNDAPAVR